MPPDPIALATQFLPPQHRPLAEQFLKFAVIGTLGFVWDTCVVYTLAPFLGPYVAGVVSFIIVGSINWVANRYWTYRHMTHDAMHRQLVRFLVANSIGFVINRGTYSLMIYNEPYFRTHLIWPVAAGGIAGMFLNFFLTRRMVFR
jgi:putative flippase GtrA